MSAETTAAASVRFTPKSTVTVRASVWFRCVAMRLVVKGSSETSRSRTRLRRIHSGSTAPMNRVVVLWAIRVPPMKAKLTR